MIVIVVVFKKNEKKKQIVEMVEYFLFYELNYKRFFKRIEEQIWKIFVCRGFLIVYRNVKSDTDEQFLDNDVILELFDNFV